MDGAATLDERRRLIGRMCAVIEHRGPDDEGVYLDGEAALGLRRLSIIDLATGQQPISNEDGSAWVVFNGEVYNFAELRDGELWHSSFRSRACVPCFRGCAA